MLLPEITDDGDCALGAVKAEAAVRVAAHDPVADGVAYVKVQGWQGEEGCTQGQGPGNLTGAGHFFKT